MVKYLEKSKLSPSKDIFWVGPWNEKESIKIISIENFISEIEIQFELNIKFFRLRKDVWSKMIQSQFFSKKRQFYENSSLFMMVNRLDNWLFL